ncbi:L,D-transpeptidase family protein [Longimicrobium sp.]|uniref:L,D-transpeptidase n=1 Tax=Longimicrobium sp. TaxID=2029185 RepID=UPI003B3B42E7
MSWSATRTIFGLLLATGALTAVLMARGIAGEEPVVDALRPVDGEAPGTAAERATADSARPAKPKRQIVPDVEVVVNIPSGRLQLVQGDSVVRTYPVSVGSARYATPVGDYLLATVIFNPWWHPPESEWARNRKPTPPGPGNPMGRVKLHMDDLIYIHGTTSEGRLGAPASHGCIRMSNTDVVDLARRLHRIANPSMGDGELDAMSRAGTTQRHTVMSRSIRMRVSYQVAELRGDRLHVFPDVYGRSDGLAAHVKRELARGGVDTAAIPAPAMARLRQGAARGGASFALADIPTLQPLPPEPPREQGPRVLGDPAPLREVPRDTIVIGRVPEPVSEPAIDDAPVDEPVTEPASDEP